MAESEAKVKELEVRLVELNGIIQKLQLEKAFYEQENFQLNKDMQQIECEKMELELVRFETSIL